MQSAQTIAKRQIEAAYAQQIMPPVEEHQYVGPMTIAYTKQLHLTSFFEVYH
jgi:hypothetical protein